MNRESNKHYEHITKIRDGIKNNFKKQISGEFPVMGILHNTFITINRMYPEEYKDGGKALSIDYSFLEILFGKMLIASTSKGICYLAFCEEKKEDIHLLQKQFPNAIFSHTYDTIHKDVFSFFKNKERNLPHTALHLKGTEFQYKVWDALLKIPMGEVSTYGDIASQIGNPKASRAVGTAIGSNPISFLIPCHRVIRSTGDIGGYMWGSDRKKEIIRWERSIQ